MFSINVTNIFKQSFPKDPVLKQKWLKALGLPNITVTGNQRICSDHFEPSCMMGANKRLQRIAYIICNILKFD